jgi:hypothetical protein
MQAEAAWAAGFYEGKRSLFITGSTPPSSTGKVYYYPHLQLTTMRNQEHLLLWHAKRWGGRLYRYADKPTTRWNLRMPQLYNYLSTIMPYLQGCPEVEYVLSCNMANLTSLERDRFNAVKKGELSG